MELWLFAIVGLLGAAITLFASFGDATVTATTGGIYTALQSRGLEGDPTLVRDLYDVVMRLQGPWAIVQLLGFATLVAGIAGFISTWRRLR